LKGIKHRQALYEILGYREPVSLESSVSRGDEEPSWIDRRS